MVMSGEHITEKTKTSNYSHSKTASFSRAVVVNILMEEKSRILHSTLFGLSVLQRLIKFHRKQKQDNDALQL